MKQKKLVLSPVGKNRYVLLVLGIAGFIVSVLIFHSPLSTGTGGFTTPIGVISLMVIPGSITMMLLSLISFIPINLLRIIFSVIILGLFISYLIVIGLGILLNCIDQCNQWSGINRLIVWTMDIGYVIGLFRFVLLHDKSKK